MVIAFNQACVYLFQVGKSLGLQQPPSSEESWCVTAVEAGDARKSG